MKFSLSMLLTSILFVPLAFGQEVVLSTYVGGPKADALYGAAVLPNGSAVVGGVVDASLGGKKNDQITGGQGIVQVLSKAGKTVAEKRFPAAVDDLDADGQGNIYITGAMGTIKLDGSLRKTIWESKAGGAQARVCPGPKGGAVVLANHSVTVLDGAGQSAASFPVSCGYGEDVAFSPKLGRIYYCGFDNKHGTPPKQRNYPVQVAFVRALDLQGKQVWAAYGWGGQQVADIELMADTRAYRLAIGGDGKLYVGGESAGGNTMWMRSSLKLEEKVKLPKGDAYQQAYNTAANHITAVVRLDPKTGQSEMATLLLARLPAKGNKGNTLRMRALAADAQGNVYVGGPSSFYPPKSQGSFGRDGGGAYLVIFNDQFQRTYATTLAGDGTTNAIAVSHGTLVVAGDCKQELATHRPLKAVGDAEGDGFVTLFALPDKSR